jgi:predicted nucleic acid-binding protein
LRTVVVDSSVALKWFIPERLTDEAASLLDARVELLAPDLIYPEAGNILWKKVGRGEIEPRHARDILAAFGRVPLLVVSSSLLVEAALEIALAHRRTVYDALYVALAVARESVFVTADDKLVGALRGGPLAAHVQALAMLSRRGDP